MRFPNWPAVLVLLSSPQEMGRPFSQLVKNCSAPNKARQPPPSQSPAVAGSRQHVARQASPNSLLFKLLDTSKYFPPTAPPQCYKLINLGKIHPKASGLWYQTQVILHTEDCGFRAMLWLWTWHRCCSALWNGNIPAGAAIWAHLETPALATPAHVLSCF